MEKELIKDEGIILRVKNWQTADKYAVCFTKEHGKLRFISYGARYSKNIQGRLLQPFAALQVEVQPGQRLDKLKGCELVNLPKAMDMKQMAYGAVIAELTAIFTEDHAPQPELYELLTNSLQLLTERNPRIVVLAFAVQLLEIVGLAPQMHCCVGCGELLSEDAEAWFSAGQGGVVCEHCRAQVGDDVLPCSSGVRHFWQQLVALDFQQPQSFSVKGGDLMGLEKILYRFIFFQTDKPLNSLNFLAQLGL